MNVTGDRYGMGEMLLELPHSPGYVESVGRYPNVIGVTDLGKLAHFYRVLGSIPRSWLEEDLLEWHTPLDG